MTSGLYDLGKVFALQKDAYIRFVKDLFEIEETRIESISGIEIHGKKREFYTKIFPYWTLDSVSVDEDYLQELHENIGSKIHTRFYIVAPANNVDFISDYHEIENVRYYFLKVPYQVIRELHSVKFKKLRQPRSKNNINDLDEAVGFHFIRQPEVRSEVVKSSDSVKLKISHFESFDESQKREDKFENFDDLAMLLFDYRYDGKEFIMDRYVFADELVNRNEHNKDASCLGLSQQMSINIDLPMELCGDKIMVIYIDVYGNEFREVVNIEK